jgi:adenylate kinase
LTGRKIVILLGAPGAGKGTQARSIMRHLSIPQIATGDMLRDAMLRQTPLGLEAKKKVEAGGLVSDEIVNGIVAERIQQEDCRNGFILDGYPRTVSQAETFTGKLTKEDRLLVIEIAVDTAKLGDRLMGRSTCSRCGDIYNASSRVPKQPGVCDRCGSPLIHRSDDQEHLIVERLRTYREDTYPLVEHYRKAGLYHQVNGSRPIGEVTLEIVSLIDSGEPLTPAARGRNEEFA